MTRLTGDEGAEIGASEPIALQKVARIRAVRTEM